MQIIRSKSFLQSFTIALVLTLIASLAGKYLAQLPYLKILGGMILSLLIGIGYQLLPSTIIKAKAGTAFISNKFLRTGIILFGFRLNVDTLIETGKQSLILAIFVVIFTIALVYLLSRAFKIDRNLSILVAVGCAICGAAAVMAISPQIRAKSEQSVLAVSIVAILGTIFTIIEVVFKPYFGLTPYQFGVFSGASLHEIAHALAAGSSSGIASLDIAMITKLSRVLLLVPVALLIKLMFVNKEQGGQIAVPWFLFGFLITSLMGTYLPWIAQFLPNLIDLASILLGMAMAALGMSANLKYIMGHGLKIFGIALVCSIILASVCLIIVKVLM